MTTSAKGTRSSPSSSKRSPGSSSSERDARDEATVWTDDHRIFYGVGRMDLHIPHSRSLKDKRSVIGSIKGRLADRARVAVIETGPQELWQRGTLGLCLVGREEGPVRQALDQLRQTVEMDGRVVVLAYETRVGCLEDEEGEE
ncbi:MAG: DUF503 family protein [Candidatus Eisenbacteria bacterium]|nr:DUF503 family protein [Candidatus Latescibacterota bacterium]MBD3303460.1 DUF503 family protein [Candidatus Eisenbacteria bacterium]